MEEKKERKRYKRDGETRDRRGRYAGKVVTMRKEHYALVVTWQKQTGMSVAEFWRQAVMRGALDVAKTYGIEASFPILDVAEKK